MLKDTLLLCDGEDCTYAINLKDHGYPECDIIDDNKIYDEIFDKAQALIDNLDELYDFDIEKGSITLSTVDRIELDVQWQWDEFYLIMSYVPEKSYAVEIVTKETAVSNDMDWKDCWRDEFKEDEYQVGGRFSSYTKLGKSDYYYRFL